MSLIKIQNSVVEFALNKQKLFWKEMSNKIQELLKKLDSEEFDNLKIEFSVEREAAHTAYNYNFLEDVDSFYWSVSEDYSNYFKDIDGEAKSVFEELIYIIKSIDGEYSLGFGYVSISKDDIELDLSFSFNGENHKE